MKTKVITAILTLALLGFVGIGVANITRTHDKLKLRDIQLKSKQSDLLQLETKFQLLNKELEQKNLDAQKLKELEQQKQDLQKQLEQAQKDLQAKAEQKRLEQEKLAQAASITPKVYADGGSCKDWILQAGIADVESAYKLMMRESSCIPSTVNSVGCIGLGQNCPDKYGVYWLKQACPNWQNDPVCQMKRFNVYAIGRYGSWSRALAFSYANNWY